MTWSECQDELAKHPREVCCIVAAHIAKCVWKPDEEWSLAAAWAIGVAQDFARGESDASAAGYAAADDAADASAANAANATDAAAYAAYVATDAAAAYATDPAAYASAAAYAAADASAAYAYVATDAAADAARSSWYQYAVALLPPPGQWGPWRQVRGLAVAGDYFVRIHEDGWLFVERAQLTQYELVCLDAILEHAA